MLAEEVVVVVAGLEVVVVVMGAALVVGTAGLVTTVVGTVEVVEDEGLEDEGAAGASQVDEFGAGRC